MIIKYFLFNLFFIQNIFSFNLKSSNRKKINLKMIDSYDLDIIHNQKNLFFSESYNNVIQDIINNKINKIYIDKKYNQMINIDNTNFFTDYVDHFHKTDINPIEVPNIIEKASSHNIPVEFVDFNSQAFSNIQHLASDILSFIGQSFPILLFSYLILSFIRSNNMNFNSNQNNFLISEKDKTQFKKENITLSSWAGSPEVIEECTEVISYIDKKEIFEQVGAEMPKGILLEGPPGTGKTLLAKAIATETDSNFISISGSEFIELYVGVGASRVRELFETARKNRPAIIFIDEIDAVGKQRSSGVNMGNDEKDQTLNQLLYEMDGFNDNTDIIILAATNRRDILDQALLRPGRFDRIIRIPLPDKYSREKILDYYIKKKTTEGNINITTLAELTDGFSGAQLKNLINEAAILTARNNMTKIKEEFIFEAFEKSIVGLIRKNADVKDVTKTRVAIHEGGHSLLAMYFNDCFDFKKASVQPTYNGAGGYTIFTEKTEIKDGGLYTRDLLKKRLAIMLGGKAAESLYYGNEQMSLGAIEDLKQANSLAQRMIGNFGMGNKLEVFYNQEIDDNSDPFSRSLSGSDKYSEFTKTIFDKESLDLVKEAYTTAKTILNNNYDKLLSFSELLKTNTTIMANDIKIF